MPQKGGGMNTVQKRSSRLATALCAVALLIGTTATGGVLAVDFGAAYTTVNINHGKNEIKYNGDYNFDGVEDDRMTSVAFGTVFTPPNSANWTTVPGKSNGTIYHGVSLAVLGKQSIDPTISIDRIASNNRIQIGNTTIAGETLSQAVAIYWTAADFLNGQAAKLADEAAGLSVTLNSTGSRPNVRFMVQAGGQWYVSASSSQTTFSINGATSDWYAFDPTAKRLFLNESSLGTAVSGSSLGDITAAGVYGQATAYSGSSPSLFGMDALQITVIPEPATIGMLGLGALATLLFRRLRSKE